MNAISAVRARRGLLCAACLAFAVASAPAAAAAQDRAAAVDTIRLRFKWPAGARARVETTRTRTQMAERRDSTSSRAAYSLTVQEHPNGLLISHDDFTFPATGMSGADLQSVAERLGAMLPKFVVTGKGEFVRIQDLGRMKAQLDSMMAQLLDSAELGAAKETLEAMLSEDALTALAAQDWNAVVGMWVDADFEAGELYELEEEAPLPMIPGATVPMVSEFSVKGRTSCAEGGSSKDCVEIHLVAEPDAEAMKKVLDAFMQRLASGATPGAFGFEELNIETELVLITEPTTLLPHRVRITKSVSGVVSAAGQRGRVSQQDVRTFRYTYRR